MTALFQSLDKALREEDIEDLISSGAPDDEYTSEAKEIAEILEASGTNNLSQDLIISAIAKVWTESFDRSPEEIEIRMPAFSNIAQKLVVR